MRRGTGALKLGIVVEQCGTLGPAQAHGGLAHQAQAKNIGLVTVAAIRQKV